MNNQPLFLLICYLSISLLPLVAQPYQTNYENFKSDHEPTQDPSNTEEPLLAPPTDIEFVRLNDTSVVVKWEIAHSAHAMVQFFKIQYRSTKKDGPKDWKTDNREIPATSRAHQVNGLRPGNHLFIVLAVYDNDDNVASEQFKYKLKARSKIPDEDMPEMKAPVIFWHEARQDYLRFKWRYTPKEKDMPYYGYLVYYRSAHAVTDFTIYNTLDENVEIAELEYDTPYEAKVVAYNQVGVSEFSSLVTVRTNSSTPNKPAPISPFSTSTTPNPTSTLTISTTAALTTTTTTTSTTTRRPSLTTTTVSPTDNLTIISKTSLLQSIYEAARHLSDTSWITILLLLPTLLIVSILICVLSCRHSSSKQPTQMPAAKFDFEINEINYFTNSFPGVEKLHTEEISNEIFRT